MKTETILSGSRGHVKLDWLESFHTFSFGQYHDSNRMGFGLLRVINDDIVQPSSGFDSHSHQNMEIITIPLQGSLFHQDHLGNRSTIQNGEVQIMSAGTGIVHSEHNPSDSELVNLFQIWIFPKEKQIMPRYGQKKFEANDRIDRFQCVVSPDEREGSLWINQDAYIHLIDMNQGVEREYSVQKPGNGAFIMSIEGDFKVSDQSIQRRDAVAVTNADKIPLVASNKGRLVVFEVPLL